MSEIGGYLSFPTYRGKMLYENQILLNNGRNCLEYILKEKNIHELYLPYYICDCIFDVCLKNKVKMIKYHIDEKFEIQGQIKENSYVLIVNWFGILTNKYIRKLSKKCNLIIDNTQCYFNKPLKNIYTIYSCRKFFGVSDGGILCGNLKRDIYQSLAKSYSYNNTLHLVGRFEKTASEFYPEFKKNEDRISNESLMKMSDLTYNILHSIDYKYDKKIRTNNFGKLNKKLNKYNKLKLKNIKGAFAYPFMHEKAQIIKEKLLKEKIYIPTLWPNCLELDINMLEYELAKNILVLPCNHKYNLKELKSIIEIIENEIGQK